MEKIDPVYRSEFIESKKEQLHKLVMRKGSLTDAEVIKLSQELDQYILAVQHAVQSEYPHDGTIRRAG